MAVDRIMVDFGRTGRPPGEQRETRRRLVAVCGAAAVLGIGAMIASTTISDRAARVDPVAPAPAPAVAAPQSTPIPVTTAPAVAPAIPQAKPVAPDPVLPVPVQPAPLPRFHVVSPLALRPSATLDQQADAIVQPATKGTYPTIREEALASGSLAPPGVLEHALATLPGTRLVRFGYHSADGGRSSAVVLVPRDLSHPVPLVISPHGRDGDGITACAHWSGLPAYARVAVVCPDGTGRFSWGSSAQITDLSRMPALVGSHLPPGALTSRVFAIGESMGGQEVLLLHGRFPKLLSGVVALDPVTDFSLRYDEIGKLAGGTALQARMRSVIGGTPLQRPGAYRARSPITYVDAIARANAVLVVWWSRRDIVVRSWRQITPFLDAIQRANPANRRVWSRSGDWKHGAPQRHDLIHALDALGLVKGAKAGPAPGQAAPLDLQFADASVGTALR